LAAVDAPTDAKLALERLTTAKQDATRRCCPGFNPLARHDVQLFAGLMVREHCLRGFTNREVREQLASSTHLRRCGRDPRRQGAKVSRILHRVHAHGLIAKIPRTRRWRVTAYGRQVMGTSLYLRYHHFPNTYSKIATLIFFLDCEQVTEKESMRDKQQPSGIKLMFSRESMMIRNDLKTQMDSPIFDTRRGLPLTPLAAALITLVGTLRWLQTNHRCRRLAAR